jgi:hypothetical protein
MTETTTAGEEDMAELEASFLSCEGAPGVLAAFAHVPSVELPPPGALEAGAMMPTVKTSRRGCC